MFAQDLIGMKAIRTKPTSQGDHSYTDTPIIILKATESHIVFKYPDDSIDARIFGNETRVLNLRWCDDGWVGYEQLINLQDTESPGLM